MTDIAHCPADGHKPRPNYSKREVWLTCYACMKESSRKETLGDAVLAWNAMVLSDLAAQERELCAVPLRRVPQPTAPNVTAQGSYSMTIGFSPEYYAPMSRIDARVFVRNNYIWLGQNPLVLP